ncbi:MAG: serine hydroxymethyltransferase [Candidatus Shapirobacteria bacterium]|nr:serine hydroxymethyltransferase [Candidatus Shapirobacteria bacterium]MDD4410288.1 serine hydroxymethyltransferase [Candidatus Shapirobacteria bacterium]
MVDQQIRDLIKKEEERQQNLVHLIPSENFASDEVRMALGSCLTNKYAEGYPGRRYYQGNEFVDQIENLAIERGKKVLGVEHLNVQPYSGSPANSAVQMALLEQGDKICGLKLSAGGHLTHGHPKITFSGKFFESVQYDVEEDGRIDYDKLEELILAEKPKMIMAGTTAYPYILDFKRFGEIADKVGAWLVADISHIAGLVVGGVHPSPNEYVHIVTSTTHKSLRGPRGAVIGVTKKGLEKDPELAKKIDKAVFPGLQGGPHENQIAALAVAFGECDTQEFKDYAAQIVKNAKALAESLRKNGLKVFGTENHLMVVEVGFEKGKDAAVKLEENGIVVNANTIPHDTASPFRPSGIRIGTPAMTTRGWKEKEFEELGNKIAGIIKSI